MPYPEQLSKYATYPLPWSPHHGECGAQATRYVLLSLMTPAFPLPSPWVHVGYRDLAGALDEIDADSPGRTTDQFIRYRALIHRLVALAEAVDPAHALDEQFSKSFEVDGARGGVITYWRRLADKRCIGWQFQENQLRFYITVEDPDLQGHAKRAEREKITEAEQAGFFDHRDVETILGSDLRAKSYAPSKWLGFNPDFVYRHRPVKPAVSTARLAQALVSMTRRVDVFADKAGYDVT